MPELLTAHTTLRLGGPAAEFVIARTEHEAIDAVAGADRAGIPVLVLGGGSNLVIGDAGFEGRVVQMATRGIDIGEDGMAAVTAGEPWDEFVAQAVGSGWAGIEALSGIPGLTGATPIQNVGAYGQDVASTIQSVRVWDRHAHEVRSLASPECGFDYRMSRFKAEPDRHVVLGVTFQLRAGPLSGPMAYAELAGAVGGEVGDCRPLGEVRDAVLALRRRKGMVLDSEDHDTWSAGSFFTNPIVRADQVPVGAPTWPQPDGRMKTSAAWLIEHAGFGKGYGNEQVSLSTKHTLALTNRGRATTADLLELAAHIRDGVREAYGITLVPEPVMINCAL